MRVILGTCTSVLTCLGSLPLCVACLLLATTKVNSGVHVGESGHEANLVWTFLFVSKYSYDII